MILLLSTASNLYWLGRYMIRIDGLCRMLPFKDDQEASRFAQAMSLPAWDANTLNQVLNDPEQPSSINATLQSVRDNMQAVRGVISQELFDVMNMLSNPKTMNKRNICQLISESNEVMADEEDTVRLFWQLGECIEQIDAGLRLKRSVDLAVKDLRMVVEMLSPLGWQRLEQPWVELQSKKDIIALYSFCDQMQSLFEDGP